MSRRDWAALIAWAVLFAGLLVGAFVSSMGPGGVYFYAQPPQDRGGMILPELDTDQHEGCVVPELWPADAVPAGAVVVEQHGDPVRYSFARAWRVTHNAERADDVYVIGLCA